MLKPEDRYRLVLEHASDVVFTADLDGRLTWVSPSVRKLTGRPPEEMIGEHLTDFVAAGDRSPVVDRIASVLGGDDAQFVGQATRPDGDPIWVSATAAPLRDDNGVIIGTVGTVRDVGDAMRARLELSASEEHYRLLAERTADVVLRVDATLHIEWVSPSITAMLGYRPDELIGRFIAELVHPPDWEAIAPVRAAELRATPAEPEHPMLIRAITADGHLLWVSSRPSPIVDDAGHLVGVVTTWTDVDQLVTTREQASATADQLRATLDTLFDPHVLLRPVRDETGQVVDFVHVEANDAACEYQQLRRAQLIGASLRGVTPAAVADELVRMMASVTNTGERLMLDDFEFPDPSHELEPRRFDVRAGRVGECVATTWRDVTDRHATEAHLSHLATHDPLTGLANRSALVDELERALSAGRRAGRLTAAIMLDLDRFKDVNDEHDHAVGDQLLKVAARRLESVVRGGDLVCRLGGDEFVIVMRIDDASEAVRVAHRIVEEFRNPIHAAGFELRTTASVGVAISTADATPNDLVHEADIAMYRAKDGGRDRVSVFNEDLRVATAARHTLEAQLRPALDLGELAVYYQPEVDLQTGEISAVEALLRWHHPSGELYSADRFIGLAEEIGVMVESGNWVVREALHAAAAWSAAMPGRLLTVRLNLSRQQLSELGLAQSFERSLLDSGMPACSVCVELSEAALIHPSVTVHDNLEHLRRLGVRLAIDNFGTGYAALAFLRERPVDMVKIDRSYISELGDNDYARRLVAGIAALAQQLGLQVGAEGVETIEQVQLLRELGCMSAQGFLFSEAVPANRLFALLDQPFGVR